MAQIIQYEKVRDIALDINGDWLVQNGDLQLIGDGPAIVQAVKIALQFFQGEWYLDESVGMPWWQSILIKNPDVGLVTAAFRKQILSVAGVQSIESLVLAWDIQSRVLTVTFEVQTNLGLLPGNIPLGGSVQNPT